MNPSKSETICADAENIGRRSFFTKSILYTSAGLSLLSVPGILTKTLAATEGKSKEEIYRNLEARIEKMYSVYHSCSQPTLDSLNNQFGLDADRTVNAIHLFAGGVAGQGETCGAVTAALLAIGFNFDEKNKKTGDGMKFGKIFFERFSKEFESTRCKEIMKHQYGQYVDFSKQEDLEVLSKPENKGKCLEVMKKTACIAADIILENS